LKGFYPSSPVFASAVKLDSTGKSITAGIVARPMKVVIIDRAVIPRIIRTADGGEPRSLS
jgi:hypothetical protein